MAVGPSSQATNASSQRAKRPHAISPRWVASIVAWFLGWPIVFFICFPSVTPGDELAIWLLGAGSVLWFLSFFGVYGILLNEAEARWPAGAAILKALGFIFLVLRIFQ